MCVLGAVADENGTSCITSPSVLRCSLACATAVACPVCWVPKPSLGLQPHQPAPWSWRYTEAGGLRLSGHGQNHPIDAMAGTESAADSFVGLGSLQGWWYVLGKGQQGGRVLAGGVK